MLGGSKGQARGTVYVEVSPPTEKRKDAYMARVLTEQLAMCHIKEAPEDCPYGICPIPLQVPIWQLIGCSSENANMALVPCTDAHMACVVQS